MTRHEGASDGAIADGDLGEGTEPVTDGAAVDGLEAVLTAARSWSEQDPDDETRAELDALVASASSGDAAARAAVAPRTLLLRTPRLRHGGAARRARRRPQRMNRVVVTQAAAGLARFLIDTGRDRSVVIGYDGRVNSDVFARDSAEVMRGLGLEVTLLPVGAAHAGARVRGARHLGVGAGVMVTASHNPPRDNGYKVYLGGEDDGSQIVPPVDGEIAAAIDAVAEGDVRDLVRATDYTVAGPELTRAYVEATAATVPAPALPVDAQPKVVYTAMHGVGWETARAVFAAAGFRRARRGARADRAGRCLPHRVLPEPEEPGAMDLSVARGVAVGADLVIANDPDADRLALAIPDGAGSFRRLSGNEVGWLLGWRDGGGFRPGRDAGGVDRVLARARPGRRAVRARVPGHADRFKWVSRVPRPGVRLRGGARLPGRPDGRPRQGRISAALALLDLAVSLAASGKTVADQLEASPPSSGRSPPGRCRPAWTTCRASARSWRPCGRRRPRRSVVVPSSR